MSNLSLFLMNPMSSDSVCRKAIEPSRISLVKDCIGGLLLLNQINGDHANGRLIILADIAAL
jgi:hypothetical protein